MEKKWHDDKTAAESDSVHQEQDARRPLFKKVLNIETGL